MISRLGGFESALNMLEPGYRTATLLSDPADFSKPRHELIMLCIQAQVSIRQRLLGAFCLCGRRD